VLVKFAHLNEYVWVNLETVSHNRLVQLFLVKDKPNKLSALKEKFEEQNRDEIKKRYLEYREKNKEFIAEKQRIYRQANKDKLKERGSTIINCQCGGTVKNKNYNTHLTSNTHLNYLIKSVNKY